MSQASGLTRRRLLVGTGGAVGVAATGGFGAVAYRARRRPLALVYRGAASLPGCSEAVAALLRASPLGFRVRYCGPQEAWQVSARDLAEATVYAQPGGGDVDEAWEVMRAHATAIRSWVRSGGCYVGFCLGGYLAGATPGFDLLPGDAAQYVGSSRSSVHDSADTVIAVRWRGRRRFMYFQDGPRFQVRASSALVLARYDTGAPAAVVARCGRGRVGVVGPHPEADAAWYRQAGLRNPQGVRWDLGFDLLDTVVRHGW